MTAVLLILAITVLAVVRLHNNEPPNAVFTPPQFDAEAQSGAPEVTEDTYSTLELPISSGKCAAAMDAAPRLEGEHLKILLTAPADNTVWIRVVLYDRDQIVGESGVLRPGEYVEAVTLMRQVTGGSQLKAKIITYEPDTYYSMGTATAEITIR